MSCPILCLTDLYCTHRRLFYYNKHVVIELLDTEQVFRISVRLPRTFELLIELISWILPLVYNEDELHEISNRFRLDITPTDFMLLGNGDRIRVKLHNFNHNVKQVKTNQMDYVFTKSTNQQQAINKQNTIKRSRQDYEQTTHYMNNNNKRQQTARINEPTNHMIDI